ncbi:hypothetical protein Tco_0190711 [Tanacetum coccineum]
MLHRSNIPYAQWVRQFRLRYDHLGPPSRLSSLRGGKGTLPSSGETLWVFLAWHSFPWVGSISIVKVNAIVRVMSVSECIAATLLVQGGNVRLHLVFPIMSSCFSFPVDPLHDLSLSGILQYALSIPLRLHHD